MPPNTLSSTSIIVPELLTSDNYANWSAMVRNYLLAQDLWDIVEATTEPPTPKDDVEFKAWRKNNAATLYAILISCGADTLLEIREMSCAKSVWDKLASMYGPSNSSNIPADPPNTPEISFAGTNSIVNDNDYWVAVSCFRQSQEYARIGNYGGTSLHSAVIAGDIKMVKKLVKRYMSIEELEKKDDYGWTALARAAIQQNTEMVEFMLRKNSGLLLIPDNLNRIPLITALEYGNTEMALFLYYSSSIYHQTLRDIDASTALARFILLNNFDVAFHLLVRYPNSPIVPNIYDTSPLAALASKSSAFPSGNQLVFWKKWIYDCIPIPSRDSGNCILRRMHPNEVQSHQVKIRRSGSKQNLYDTKVLHQDACKLLQKMCTEVQRMNRRYVNEAILQAVKGGNVEFITEMVKKDPRLYYTIDTMGRNLFFYAVLHRQNKIFGLIYTLDHDQKNFITNALDSSGNTILHMAAMLEHSIERDRLTGAALKMQSELQWFKEVERTCLPWIHEIRNDTKMTARELFTQNHKDMLNEGEKWMKGTASSFTLIGTIIITIMFTAAFTVPGGNNQDTGFPIFSHKKLFLIFIVSDALSLFSASTSVLVFLGMVTSRYAEDDFSRSLPLKMIIGHYTLFFSIVTMMIAFCVGLFIMLPRKLWMVILTICLASVTVIQFAFMLFPLLVYMSKQILTYRLSMTFLRHLF